MKNKKIILTTLIILALLPLVNFESNIGVNAYSRIGGSTDTDHDVHDWVIRRAVDLLQIDAALLDMPGLMDVYNEITANTQYLEEMCIGAYDADVVPTSEHLKHGWDPDLHVGPILGRGAPKLAEEYFDQAIANYTLGKMNESYRCLGYTLHLIADMTVPHHTRREKDLNIWGFQIINSTHEEYESYLKQKTTAAGNIHAKEIIYNVGTNPTDGFRLYTFESWGAYNHCNRWSIRGFVDRAAHYSHDDDIWALADSWNDYDTTDSIDHDGGDKNGNSIPDYLDVMEEMLPIAVKIIAGALVYFYQKAMIASGLGPDVDGDGLTFEEEEDGFLLYSFEEYRYYAITDPCMRDCDFDGLGDDWEVFHDADNNGMKENPWNPDNNNNGILDGQEDYDSDGLLNTEEYDGLFDYNQDGDFDDIGEETGFYTDLLSSDSDSDTLPDKWELSWQFNPLESDQLNAGILTIPDGVDSFDNDDLSNYEEYIHDTNPWVEDSDGDNLWDCKEVTSSLDPLDADENNNGILDYADNFDTDSLYNYEECYFGTNAYYFDSDYDGMPDDWELENNLDPIVNMDYGYDSDGDGLSDHDEYMWGTDPHDVDSDSDTMPDGWETQYHLDPTDATDKTEDRDYDGLKNYLEYILGTNPETTDFDGDTMPDGWEYINLLNPISSSDKYADKDSDGLKNYLEYQKGCSPINSDSDGDTMRDGWEYSYGLNPASSSDKYGDKDGDGVKNYKEYQKGSRPDRVDLDLDGLNDYLEIYIYNTKAYHPDLDNDGYTDLEEVIAGTDPNNASKKPSSGGGDPGFTW